MRPTSNAQHDQRYKSDADEQRYERDGVVFEPMPITGKHDVLSLFQMDYENRSAVAHPEAQARMGLLLTRLLSENQALILELLDWKKFYVRQIVYFPNGHCRRRCGFRDGTFRHRLASTRVQPKTYRHRGEPGGNAYDRASHRSSPARAKLG